MVDVVMEELCNISGYLKKTDQPLLQEVRHFGLVPSWRLELILFLDGSLSEWKVITVNHFMDIILKHVHS